MHFSFLEIKKAIKEDYWAEIQNETYADDWLTEFADNLVPVYYNDIINDWKEMPAEFNDSGAEMCGEDDGIFSRMTADLWNYYKDQVFTAYDQVKGELEDANA